MENTSQFIMEQSFHPNIDCFELLHARSNLKAVTFKVNLRKSMFLKQDSLEIQLWNLEEDTLWIGVPMVIEHFLEVLDLPDKLVLCDDSALKLN